jgi:hypothetical protein
MAAWRTMLLQRMGYSRRNPMRRILLVLLLALVLSGCNSGVSSDAAAKAFINALFSGNAAGARDALCERAKPLLTDESISEMSQTPVDTSGLSYSVRDATDTTANVVVSGNVRVGSGDTQQELDFATFGGSLTTLPAIVENSAWKICPADLSGAAG